MDPAYARRGLGRLLIRYVETWGRAQGRPATTLTTFRDVRWKAPYYRCLGYDELSLNGLGSELTRVMELQSTASRLGSAARCAMCRTVSCAHKNPASARSSQCKPHPKRELDVILASAL